jgi:hypothetical protein
MRNRELWIDIDYGQDEERGRPDGLSTFDPYGPKRGA